MNWNRAREQFRGRLVAKYNQTEAKSYDTFVGTLSDDDEKAYLADIQEACPLASSQFVLDVGAGSGALTKVLARLEGMTLTALEPSPSMRELLQAKPELANATIVGSGCDNKTDKALFSEASFDLVVSRQVVNSLFDPLVAFQNWLYWLKPGGSVVIIDGIYGRDGWTGIWQEEVDVTPLSACQSIATIPYLLEFIGFHIETVRWMTRTNLLPATRTKRYLVVGRKPE
jgi:SAM-dependent methyltransferase